MGFLRGLRLGWRLFRRRHDVEFLGPCPCGLCGLWHVRLEGRTVHLHEEAYDKLRYLTAIS